MWRRLSNIARTLRSPVAVRAKAARDHVAQRLLLAQIELMDVLVGDSLVPQSARSHRNASSPAGLPTGKGVKLGGGY